MQPPPGSWQLSAVESEGNNVNILLSPPLAFLIYIPIVWVIVLIGKRLAGPENASELKSSIYGSGEVAPKSAEAPGYRSFFLIAFFFAFLHLGMLVLGTGGRSQTEALYLVGLLVALLALMLG
jgi:NADH:ubiquinone oxidoreductase subunit 3 (subunit A)